MPAIPAYQPTQQGIRWTDVNQSPSSQSRLQLQTELLDRVYEPVREALERVMQRLRGLRRDQPPFLSQLLDHVLENTGKRVRPAVTLLASGFHPNDGRNAETMASAVEILHVATLIHDDTVDASDLRRGKVTVSTRYGAAKALLLGDYLLATAASFVCETEDLRVIRRFSELATELASGELHELSESYTSRQTREKYLKRIYRKTASLFSAAAEAGGVLSGAPERTVKHLREYGYNLGMAFQIVDDILDFDATTEEIGKPVGNDLAHGVVTLPAIIAIESHPTDNAVVQLFPGLGEEDVVMEEVDQDRLRRALDLIQSSSVIDDSYAVAAQFCDSALDSLSALEQNASRDSLEELVRYLTSRRS